MAFDGVAVAWTVRRTRGGVTVDRVWARSADPKAGKVWLHEARADPTSGIRPGHEARVLRIATTDVSAGWGREGDVVMALESPEDTPTREGDSAGPRPTP